MSKISQPSFQRSRAAIVVLCVAIALFVVGCKHLTPLDTTPLDHIGMNYDAIQRLKVLQITQPEVAEIAKARQGGLSEDGCVELVQIFHGRPAPFDAGDSVAGLVRAGLSEDTVLELAKLNQLGLGVGELQAMRLAGLSDDIVIEFARRRAAGMPVLSGASLAGLKNTGLKGSTLLELVHRGVPDTQADAIVSFRRHGASDADVLRRFNGS